MYLPALGYLSRENLSRSFRPSSNSVLEGSSDFDAIEDEDDATVGSSESADSLRGECRVDASICWSPSFRVPVLWFQAFDHSGSPLTLEEIASSTIFHRHGSSRSYPLTSLEDASSDAGRLSSTTEGAPVDSVPFISRSEHPATGRPTWFLHPCETQTIVHEVLSASVTAKDLKHTDAREWARRWIETWFMVVKSVIDLS